MIAAFLFRVAAEPDAASKTAVVAPKGLDIVEPPAKKDPTKEAQSLLRTAYTRLIKAATDVEKAKGEVVALPTQPNWSKAKLNFKAKRAFDKDPLLVSNVSDSLAKQAFLLVGKQMPLQPQNSEKGPKATYSAAYHHLLSAAEGVELVRRHAMELPPKKLAAFMAHAQRDPDEIEQDVDALAKDVEEAEEEVEEAAEKVDEAVSKVTKTEAEVAQAKKVEAKADDKEDMEEAEAVSKEAKKELADADDEIGEGEEVVGTAKEDQDKVEEAKKDQEKAQAEEDAAAVEHDKEKSEHEAADKAEEDAEATTAEAKKEHAEAQEEHEEAKEEHVDAMEEHTEAVDEHAEAKGKPKSGAWQKSTRLPLLLALPITMFF